MDGMKRAACCVWSVGEASALAARYPFCAVLFLGRLPYPEGVWSYSVRYFLYEAQEALLEDLRLLHFGLLAEDKELSASLCRTDALSRGGERTGVSVECDADRDRVCGSGF